MPKGSVDEIVDLAERQLGPDWMDCIKKGKEDAKITVSTCAALHHRPALACLAQQCCKDISVVADHKFM